MLKIYLKYILLTGLVILSQLFVVLQNYKRKDFKISFNTTLQLYYSDEVDKMMHQTKCSELMSKDPRLLQTMQKENFLLNKDQSTLVYYNKIWNLTVWSSLLSNGNVSKDLFVCDEKCELDDSNLFKILLVVHPFDRLNRLYRDQVVKGGLSVTFYKNMSELLGIKR